MELRPDPRRQGAGICCSTSTRSSASMSAGMNSLPDEDRRGLAERFGVDEVETMLVPEIQAHRRREAADVFTKAAIETWLPYQPQVHRLERRQRERGGG